jgi:hypothetical protein
MTPIKRNISHKHLEGKNKESEVQYAKIMIVKYEKYERKL